MHGSEAWGPHSGHIVFHDASSLLEKTMDHRCTCQSQSGAANEEIRLQILVHLSGCDTGSTCTIGSTSGDKAYRGRELPTGSTKATPVRQIRPNGDIRQLPNGLTPPAASGRISLRLCHCGRIPVFILSDVTY